VRVVHPTENRRKRRGCVEAGHRLQGETTHVGIGVICKLLETIYCNVPAGRCRRKSMNNGEFHVPRKIAPFQQSQKSFDN